MDCVNGTAPISFWMIQIGCGAAETADIAGAMLTIGSGVVLGVILGSLVANAY